MNSLLTRGIIAIIWSLLIIKIYYSDWYSPITHIETSSGYGGYLALIAFLYAFYKGFMIVTGQEKIKVDTKLLVGLFLGQLLILSVFYTQFPETKNSPFMEGVNLSSLQLFFHALELLIYPIVLVLISRTAGLTLLSAFERSWGSYDIRYRLGAEISIGLGIFLTLLIIFGALGYYTLTGLIIIGALLFAIGLPSLRATWRDIRYRHIFLESHSSEGTLVEKLQPRLLTAELSYFFLTFLISISLINAIRPMPIGWDDLGVYMNFPKMMAMSGSLLEGAGLYTWQLITGTGFLFSYTAAQAFYVNQLGGILVSLVITLVLSGLLEKSGKKSLIAFPILLAAVFYAMPMNIFQQAKDMKLDPALLFFSVSTLGVLFGIWRNSQQHSKKILFIIGILSGICFGVKVTSLMLILGVLAYLGYILLGLGGYLIFTGAFIGTFTMGGLWAKIMVILPETGLFTMTIYCVSIILILVGFLIQPKSQILSNIKKYGITTGVVLLGVGLGTAPWLIKNLTETKQLNFNVLNGSGGTYTVDFEKIYTSSEIDNIKKRIQDTAITASGTATSADLGRYFGYENGVNNFLKLPAGMTFQKNQPGEFTDITFIFLALLPAALLFSRSKKWYFQAYIVTGIIAMVLYYFIDATSSIITSFFAQSMFALPYAYGIIFLLSLIPVLVGHFSLKEEDRVTEYLAFTSIYTFLFVIAAFGIVWYGIVMYFMFLLLIAAGLSPITEYTDEESEENDEMMGMKLTLSIIFFLFIGTYFVRSAFPHGWNNLKEAYYNEYKYGILNQEESIFAYRSDYIAPIAAMNLKEPNTFSTGLIKSLKNENLKSLLTENKTIAYEDMNNLLNKLRIQREPGIQADISAIGSEMYQKVLYPTPEESNTGGIYRIGTFMTYLINQNRMRYFDDSLLAMFPNYFYDPSPEKTTQRMWDVGLRYLLIDLNAATIDRDPAHTLTTSFEKLIATLRSKHLKLIKTDSVCLEIAIDEYQRGKLDLEKFTELAGVNYESYPKTGGIIPRNVKLGQCQYYIVEQINSGREDLHPTILAIKKALIDQNAYTDQEKIRTILSRYVNQSWFALFEIQEPKEELTPKTLSGVISTGAVR